MDYPLAPKSSVLCSFVIAAVALSASSAGGQPAYRVKDLDTTPSRFLYLTSGFTRLGDALYFSASDPSDSGQLWKTDGTAAGTRIVRQTPNPSPFTTGYSPEKPADLTPAGESLFFVAPEESTGRRLWKTDGTTTGTVLVRNLAPGHLTAVGDRVFFSATDGVHGYELWTSDGTDDGTQAVKDISPVRLFSFKGKLYFTASSDGAYRLWSSDGTESGTVPVKQLGAAGIGFGGDVTSQAVGSERFFFFEGTSLWSSDGTESGTHSVGPISLIGCGSELPYIGCANPYLLGVVGGTALFIAPLDSNRSRLQLWRSDGTSGGTYPLLAVDQMVYECVVSSEAAYLVISGNSHVTGGVWRSDGTPAGTTLVAGLSAGALSWAGNALYFAGYDGTRAAVWRSDGTPGGAVALVTVEAGCSFDSLSVLDRGTFAELNGSVHFVLSCGSEGPVLWRTDGTAAGTAAVGPLPGGAGTAGSSPVSLTAAGGTVVFAVDQSSPSLHFRLWSSDGTEAGTFSYATTLFATDVANSRLPGFEVLGATVFFSGGDATFGQEPWRTDGTPGGTRLIRDIAPGGANSYPIFFGATHGAMLFSVDNFGHSQLWRTDGTSEGTSVIKEDAGPLWPTTNVAGDIYYSLWNGFLHQLWRTDGTASGTVLVKDISRGWFGVTLNRLKGVGGHVYFVVATPDSSNSLLMFESLYESDGTEAGTYVIHQAPFETVAPYFRGLTAAGDVLYYGVDDRGHKNRDYSSDLTRCDALWKRDPVTHLNDRVKNFAEAPGGFFLCDLVEFHGMVYLAASDGTHGLELWRSDGTEAGTVMVKDIDPGPAGSSPTSLKVMGRYLLFAASDGEHGKELWVSDGTADGTRMLQDINPGPSSSAPSDFTLVGGRVFFVADDGATGREPWAMPASEFGIPPTISRPRKTRALPPRGGS